MATKYIYIFQSKALQNLPKLGFLVWKQSIWQPCNTAPDFSTRQSSLFITETTILNSSGFLAFDLFYQVFHACRILLSGTDVTIFKIFLPKNLAKKLAFFAQTTASFWKQIDNNIGFWEKRQFFRRKLAKIAENCDHDVDPWLNQNLKNWLEQLKLKPLLHFNLRKSSTIPARA
jgi:hypothetical protein